MLVDSYSLCHCFLTTIIQNEGTQEKRGKGGGRGGKEGERIKACNVNLKLNPRTV